MKTYEKLKVYEKSYELARDMYVITKKLPNEEKYGLISQIRRAATSIPLNIAEGYGKMSGSRETARFLQMARGSCAEMEVLVNFIKDFGYITEEEHIGIYQRYDEVGKMLTGLIKTITGN